MIRKILALALALTLGGAAHAQTSYPNLPALGSLSNSDLLADYPSGGPLKKITMSQLSSFLTGSFLTAPVTNSELATMAPQTIKCNPNASSTLTPVDCTATQVNAFLGAVGGPASSITPGATIGMNGDVSATGVLFTGASNITLSGTIQSGAVTAGKMSSGAAVGNIGYTPVNKAGDTMTGFLTTPSFAANGAAGTLRQFLFETSGSQRWNAFANTSAETGGNSGSDFAIARYNDAGSFIDNPVSISRSTGIVVFSDGVSISGSLTIPAASITGVNLSSGAAVANIGYTPVAPNDSRFGGPTQIIQNTNYTFVQSDAGGQIYHSPSDATARTWTIPANASVSYNVGTKLDLVNDCSAGVITLMINSDTLIFFPSGSSGSRTIAACGEATITKVSATRWIITGVGVT